MVDRVFPQNYITQEGSHGKYPVKTCCVSDDLSGDMLVPRWPNLVFTPQPLRAVGLLFSPMVSRWADRWAAGKVCLACISGTVRCRKLILGEDVG